METWVWIVIAVAAVLIIAAVIGTAIKQQQSRRTVQLQKGFGPEYDRAVDKFGDRKQAESALRDRQERVSKLQLRTLSASERARFLDSWSQTQAHFVDEPAEAISDAKSLVDEAMQARGYPVGDFDQKAADISVDHPYVVDNYRSARNIAKSSERGEASTEELRQGMVHDRSLFNELLNDADQTGIPKAENGKQPSRTGRPEGDREARRATRR